MKLYQVLVPAFLCVLAIIVTRTDAQEKMTALRSKLYQITKELEEQMRDYEYKDEEENNQFDDEKRGMKKASRPWNPLYGQTGISFGKRADDIMERTRNQRDQRAKTRSRYIFGHSALGFGKRAEYPQQDLWNLEGVDNADLEDFVEVPAKKALGFTGNTGILFGKRNADADVE